jgi:sugar transferase (PEP-CTERM/EpsH1 system associated)
MSSHAPLIVHVVYRLSVGGLENGVVNLVNRLPDEAWRHAIVALTDVDAQFARRITRAGVELFALHKSPGHGWRLYPRLVSLFRRLRPSIVHTRNLAALETMPAAWFAGVPVRIHGEHGRDAADPDGRNRRRQRVRRLYKPFVTRYVAVSPDLATYLHEAIGVGSDRIDQLYNGVDCEAFAPPMSRAPIRGCPFDPSSSCIVGTVGRLDPVKNHVGLVEAFAEALRRAPALAETMRLVIVGEGEERGRIEAALDEAGIRRLVWLPGERADVAAVLRGLDLFVLPSIGEGVSNTILEAMASGLPVLATGVGANAELVADGVTGTIVPAGDRSSLADGIVRYAADPGRAHAHGRAGRLRVEQRFSLERMVARYHELYLASLNGTAASRQARETATGGASH